MVDMKKYWIQTYGCQMNKSDSERIATVLEKMGYQPTSKENEADLIVVNMCSVRQSAVDRIFGFSQKFVKLKSQNSKVKTILTGCILKEDKKKLKREFDIILDIKDLPNWPKFIKSEKFAVILPWQNYRENYFGLRPKYSNNFSAFIPISNGCNNFCSYCVVPFVRGPLVCRDHKEILKEIRDFINPHTKRAPVPKAPKREACAHYGVGVKEIWLLGQNVNDYQSPTDASINFAKLLKMVNEIPGDFKFFFTSPHPKDFSDELINTLAQCEKFGKYLNLPVQSGDNKTLKKMNRPYTVEQYKNLVKKIRKKIPEIRLSTDVIVGFPGETEKQFQNTVKLFKEIKFDNAYIAKYSPRPGTTAFQMKDNISLSEKKRREKILINLVKQN
jgi:tRNA-2-methylthio-N6-dimethylallyladenosine synthase